MSEWNANKLDQVERELTARVNAGLRDPQERETAEVLGYWMYRLRECREEV